MRTLNNLPKILLELPYEVRIGLTGLCALLTIILYIILSTSAMSVGNLSVFAIPIALAAWIFKRYGVLSCLGSFILVIIIYHVFTARGLTAQFDSVMSLGVGLGALLIVGLLISSLRDVIDLSEDAHMQIALIYEKQQQLNEIKDQFILNVNHELRTPLTAVYGYLELLRNYNGQIDSEMQAKFVENAMHSCEELQLLTNNILDTIQIANERNHLKLEELYVADIVYEVITSLDPRRLQEHPVEIDIPEHLVIFAQDQYVRQILRNLLSNAFKYAPVETPINIRAYLYGKTVQRNHPAPEVCISVQDCGPGIPPEEIPRLFGQFVRLERDLSGKVRGTGLGLYVSKQLVEAMNGSIWVESTGVVGEGSCFNFTLPCVTRVKVSPKLQERLIPIENVHIVQHT
ncbi:MAG TPA: HAMP domain-containing sensor histidine kinase [Ktedonobacteraceae bacterium]|jgi:signal transduction histidine kinase